MPQVAIEKIDEKKSAGSNVLNEMNTLAEQIRNHAFELFERRGASYGSDVDDWLHAERDLFRIPESELVDREGKFLKVTAQKANQAARAQIRAA